MGALLFISCTEFSQSVHDTLKTEEEVKQSTMLVTGSKAFSGIRTRSVAANAQALQKAEDALRRLPEFEGKAIKIYGSAHFYHDGRIVLGVEDAERPGFVDKYTYRKGKWKKSEPVSITHSNRFEDDLVALEKVPFTNANKVYASIREKMRETGSKETHLTVYFVPYKGTVLWYPTSLRTERSTYSLKFDEGGNLLQFKQH